jgi:hypothetical protein
MGMESVSLLSFAVLCSFYSVPGAEDETQDLFHTPFALCLAFRGKSEIVRPDLPI